MSVHMIRVLVEAPKGEAATAVNNWVANYSEWTGDPVEHRLNTVSTNGTEYVRGDYRFVDEGETPTAILEDLSTRLQSIQTGLWHRLGYHVCSHDESEPHACSWDQSLEWGSVPGDVPQL